MDNSYDRMLGGQEEDVIAVMDIYEMERWSMRFF